MAKKHEWKLAKMAQEGHTTFQEVFAMTILTESIKLLPWCIPSAVSSQYISEALVTTMQLGKNTPATIAVPEPKQSTSLGPSSRPTHCSETPPSIIPLLPDLPLMGTPPVGCPFAEFLATSTQKKQDCSSITARGPVLTPKKLKMRVVTAALRATITCQNPYPRLGLALNKGSRNLTAPFLSNQGHCWPWWWSSCRKFMEHWGSSILRLQLGVGQHWGLWQGHSLWRLCLMLRHRGSIHLKCLQEVPEQGMGFL